MSKSTGTPATRALTAAGVTFSVHTYNHDPTNSSYGLEAANALGISAELVLKTICVEVDGQLCVAVVPVDATVDLKAVAATFSGKRATLADRQRAERVTGYIAGGISPLGQKRLLPTVLDSTAAEHETIYVSGGRRGFDVGLAPSDLIRMTHALMAPIARHD